MTRIVACHEDVACAERTALGCSNVLRGALPSHALHAAAFSVLLIGHYPDAAWLLTPAALLIGLSRVALGLHYPSDVAAGAAIGAATAAVMLALY